MNTKTLKGIGVTISLLVGIGAASPALAKATSARALGIEGNAIDVWTFDCPEGFTKGQARVKDLAATNNAAANVQVVLSKDGSPTQQVTDEDGEAGSDRLWPLSMVEQVVTSWPSKRPRMAWKITSAKHSAVM